MTWEQIAAFAILAAIVIGVGWLMFRHPPSIHDDRGPGDGGFGGPGGLG